MSLFHHVKPQHARLVCPHYTCPHVLQRVLNCNKNEATPDRGSSVREMVSCFNFEYVFKNSYSFLIQGQTIAGDDMLVVRI